jgi:glycosyltransferase involved in cell wall biosynthesis
MATATLSPPRLEPVETHKPERPLRVLFVINSLLYGGAETQVIALSRELASRGHAVVIHTLRPDNPRAKDLDTTDVQVVPGEKRWKFDPGLLLAIRREIARFKPDVVHGFLPEGNLYARLAGGLTRVPTLNSERNDNYTLSWKYNVVTAMTHRMITAVVANSYAGGAFAQRAFRMPADRVHVVWNGVDEASIEARRAETTIDLSSFFPDAGDIKVACVVGMIKPQKDYLLALRVARALNALDPQWRTLLVGGGLPHIRDYYDRVLAAFTEMQLADCAAFAGERSDAVEIVRQSSVLFSTSLHEGCPNVVLEAMTVGTPAVSTQYSDIRRILPNDWQVVGSRDPEAIARAILRADAERRDVACAQRQWIDANATLAAAGDRLEAVYRQYAEAGAR